MFKVTFNTVLLVILCLAILGDDIAVLVDWVVKFPGLIFPFN